MGLTSFWIHLGFFDNLCYGDVDLQRTDKLSIRELDFCPNFFLRVVGGSLSLSLPHSSPWFLLFHSSTILMFITIEILSEKWKKIIAVRWYRWSSFLGDFGKKSVIECRWSTICFNLSFFHLFSTFWDPNNSMFWGLLFHNILGVPSFSLF